jgi:hypothetical protein
MDKALIECRHSGGVKKHINEETTGIKICCEIWILVKNLKKKKKRMRHFTGPKGIWGKENLSVFYSRDGNITELPWGHCNGHPSRYLLCPFA